MEVYYVRGHLRTEVSMKGVATCLSLHSFSVGLLVLPKKDECKKKAFLPYSLLILLGVHFGFPCAYACTYLIAFIQSKIM